MKIQASWLRALPWLAAVLSCWPLLGSGFPRGHDWILELTRVAEYQAALIGGQLPPYWAENLYGGYGSPVYLFYAPLFSAGASALGWATGAVSSGATWMVIVLSLISVPAIVAMLRAALSLDGAGGVPDESAVRVGACVYLLHPYLIGDKLLRNADAEFAGLCLMPLVLAGLFRAGTQPRRAFFWLSGGLALTVLAHNLTALVALGIAFVAAGVLYGAPIRPRTWVVIGASVLAGLALAAFFWVPAFSMTPLVRTEELLQGKFDFHLQFKPMSSLFGYEKFYAAGVVTPLAVLACAVVALQTRSRLAWATLAGALGAVFLMTPASTAIWEHAPLLALFQFPWRWGGPLALFAALGASLAFARFTAGRPAPLRLAAELAAFALVAFNAAPHLGQYRPLSSSFLAREGTVLSPGAIATGTRSVTVRDEYLPRGADANAWKRDRPTVGSLVWVRPPAKVERIRDDATHVALRVRAAEPTRLRVARWFFPGWSLEVNGEGVPLEANRVGSIDLDVPAGESRVTLVCRAPPPRRAMLLLSGVGLAVWLWILVRPPAWLTSQTR